MAARELETSALLKHLTDKLRYFSLLILALRCSAETLHGDIPGRFAAASSESEQQLRGSVMSVDISAGVPRLDKTATLQGFREVSPAGAVTYSSLRLSGDAIVRHEIIARYLAAEENVGGARDLRLLALTGANYKFKFRALETIDGKPAYLFLVRPRHRREGSFEGNLWIDPTTDLPVRESGHVIQHSVFLRRLTMVRKFRIVDHTAFAERTQIEIDTRLVGKANLVVKLSPPADPIQQGKLLAAPSLHLTAVQ